jgi:zinc protease
MNKTVIVAALLASGTAFGQADPYKSSKIDWTVMPPMSAEQPFHAPKATGSVLTNGVKLMVVERHVLPIYTLQIVVPGAGSTSDPAGKLGLAAFTADLLDEGVPGMGAVDLSSAFEALGARVTTSTDEEASYITVEGLTRTLDGTLDLLAKVLTSPAFDEKEAARVHSDRVTELQLRRDRPGSVASIILRSALHGTKSPFGHPVGGHVADMKALTVADVRTFHREHYDPARIVVVAVGDVTPKDLQTRLESRLKTWQNVTSASARPVVSPTVATKSRLLIVDRKAAEQTTVQAGVLGVPLTHDHAFALEVLANMMGGTFSSRLSNRLREQLGYTYGAAMSAGFQTVTGDLRIRTELFTPKTLDGLKEIFKMVGEVSSKPAPEDELRKAKQNLIRQMPQQFDSNSEAAASFSVLAVHGLTPEWFEQYIPRIEKVTADDVQKAAATYLGKGLVVVLVGDLTTLKPRLAELGLGNPAMYNPDGLPIAAPSKAPIKKPIKKTGK